MTGLVDTHCHLAHCDGSIPDVLDRARAAGLESVVDIGMGLQESQASVERAERTEGVVAAVGLHPNELDEFSPAAMDRLRELARSAACVGIGETGIDFYRDHETPARQREAFRSHIALAKELDRALIIHCRDHPGRFDAHAVVLDELDAAGPPDRVVMHCFSGDAGYAHECAGRGFFCSFAGNVTFSKADDLREAAAVVPLDLLLVETDAPFLAPQPKRGKRNEPAYVVHTAEALARLRGEQPQAFAERLRSNARRALGLT